MSGKFHHSSFGLVHAFGPFADKVEGFVKDFVDEQDPGPSPVDPNAKPTVPGTGTTSFTWAGKDYTSILDVPEEHTQAALKYMWTEVNDYWMSNGKNEIENAAKMMMIQSEWMGRQVGDITKDHPIFSKPSGEGGSVWDFAYKAMDNPTDKDFDMSLLGHHWTAMMNGNFDDSTDLSGAAMRQLNAELAKSGPDAKGLNSNLARWAGVLSEYAAQFDINALQVFDDQGKILHDTHSWRENYMAKMSETLKGSWTDPIFEFFGLGDVPGEADTLFYNEDGTPKNEFINSIGPIYANAIQSMVSAQPVSKGMVGEVLQRGGGALLGVPFLRFLGTGGWNLAKGALGHVLLGLPQNQLLTGGKNVINLLGEFIKKLKGPKDPPDVGGSGAGAGGGKGAKVDTGVEVELDSPFPPLRPKMSPEALLEGQGQFSPDWASEGLRDFGELPAGERAAWGAAPGVAAGIGAFAPQAIAALLRNPAMLQKVLAGIGITASADSFVDNPEMEQAMNDLASLEYKQTE